jgi:hypothetical protein
MWDLTVSDVHTFAVGEGQWVVHNDSCPDFIADARGTVISTDQRGMREGFDAAGLPSSPTTGSGIAHTLPNGTVVRTMDATPYAPMRASFENANGGPINPFTGKPPQPPRGLPRAARLDWVRDLTHIDQR